MKLLLVDEFFLCSLDNAGKMIGKDKTKVFFIAGVVTLEMEKVINIKSDGDIEILTDLPEELERLKEIYNFVKKSSNKSLGDVYMDYDLMDSYELRYFEDVGDYLTKHLYVETVEGKKGLLKKHANQYPIIRQCVNPIVMRLRAELLDDAEITNDTLMLAYLLYKNEILHTFFSDYEMDDIRKELHRLKEEPTNKDINEVINAIEVFEDYVTMALAEVISTGNI